MFDGSGTYDFEDCHIPQVVSRLYSTFPLPDLHPRLHKVEATFTNQQNAQQEVNQSKTLGI